MQEEGDFSFFAHLLLDVVEVASSLEDLLVHVADLHLEFRI